MSILRTKCHSTKLTDEEYATLEATAGEQTLRHEKRSSTARFCPGCSGCFLTRSRHEGSVHHLFIKTLLGVAVMAGARFRRAAPAPAGGGGGGGGRGTPPWVRGRAAGGRRGGARRP